MATKLYSLSRYMDAIPVPYGEPIESLYYSEVQTTTLAVSTYNFSVATETAPASNIYFPYKYYSLPVNADVTITGNITIHLEGVYETDLAANCQIGMAIGKVGVWGQTSVVTTTQGSELTTTPTMIEWTVDVGSISLSRGERIFFQTFIAGYPTNASMVSGYTVYRNSAVWVEFTENITFQTLPLNPWDKLKYILIDGFQGGYVRYVNGNFIWFQQANSNGKYIYSTDDGDTYSAIQSSGNGGYCYDMAYSSSQGRYVIVGSGNGNATVAYATALDGTWTNPTPPTTGAFNGVAWGNGVFVAVGNSGACATSSDGITWNNQTAISTGNFYNIAYSPEDTLFLAVGADGAWSSSNGTSWTQRSTANLYGIAYSSSLSRFVMSQYTAGDYIYTSENGTTIDSRAVYLGSSDSRFVCWDSVGGFFTLSVVNHPSGLFVSKDGIQWYELEWGGVNYGAACGNGIILCSGNGEYQRGAAFTIGGDAKYFLRDTASDIVDQGYNEKALSTSRGSTITSASATAENSPIAAPIEYVKDTADVYWFTEAFATSKTLSGPIVVCLDLACGSWPYYDMRNTVRIEIVDGDGTNATDWGFSGTATYIDGLSGFNSFIRPHIITGPTVTINAGRRIKVTLRIDDGPNSLIATVVSVISYDGPTNGAAGDSYIALYNFGGSPSPAAIDRDVLMLYQYTPQSNHTIFG